MPKLKINRKRKGSEKRGWEKKRGKNGRILGAPYPNDIQRNAVIWTVPGSSYSEENH